MAKEKPTIVIKKINLVMGGAHGGSWKVAFADFMTAMMCFFLVMWLLNQTEEVKKQVASYFSGPSVLEQQLTSYGAELTLEKLFLDLVNEPFKTLQDLLQPADFTPNILAMGSKKVVLKTIAAEMGAFAANVEVNPDRIEFEIPEKFLFEPGSANPVIQYIQITNHLKNLTMGLENAEVQIAVYTHVATMGGDMVRAEMIGHERGDLLKREIVSSIEHDTVAVEYRSKVLTTRPEDGSKPQGYVRFIIKQREATKDGKKQRKLEDLFGKQKPDTSVYDDFVKKATEEKKRSPQSKQ